MSKQVKEAFTRELVKPEKQLNLAYAALLLAEYLGGVVDTGYYMSLLDDMADDILQAAGMDDDLFDQLNDYFFKRLAFSGNNNDYYLAQNSFLNAVLDLRAGIPISLSVIYLELGWRLGLPMWGVGLPGHFIVGVGAGDTPLYVDVFNEGRRLSEADCMAMVQVPVSDLSAFRDHFLKPATKKSILFRMLLNLKQIYVRNEVWESAYRTVELLLLVAPQQTSELRDRGLVAYRLNQRQQAALDLHRYLFLVPHAPDASWVKKRLDIIENELLRLN